MPTVPEESYQFKNLVLSDKYLDKPSKLAAVIGVDDNGEPILFDFAKNPHLFIGGDQGCGKSTLIHSIIMSLMQRNTPEEFQFAYLDPKGLDYNLYKQSKYLNFGNNHHTVDMFEYLLHECNSRLKLLSDNKKKTVASYNEFAALNDGAELLPELFIILDEVSSFIDEVKRYIEQLISYGRTVGIHLIIADTNPTIGNVLKIAKLIPNKIVFRFTNADYKVLLERKDAVSLPDDGEILCDFRGTGYVHGHSCFVSEEEIKSEVAKNIVEIKKVKPPEKVTEEKVLCKTIEEEKDYGNDTIADVQNGMVINSKEQIKEPERTSKFDGFLQFLSRSKNMVVYSIIAAVVIMAIYFVLNIPKETVDKIMSYVIGYGFFPAVIILCAWLSKRKGTKGRRYNIYAIDNISDGHDFEYVVADLLKNVGFYNVKVTVGSGDFGIDVVGWYDGASYAIQCKKYSGKVGVSAVQEAYAGRSYYGCNYAMVITNNYFTPAAIKLAKSTGVILWDRNNVKKLLNGHI